MPSMARFGRAKKTPKAIANNANSDMLVSPTSDSPRRSPRVSLPHVETQLNMHQYSNLFDRDSPERLKAVESSAESINSHSSNTRTNGSTLTNSDSMTTEWSSAVGHAATGKSGRVIHNLQEDIARLTRECSVYRSRAEETQRMNDAFKTQVQNMTERLRNLEQAHETNLHSISRKDKKIEELRAEVQSEKDRRMRAETETNKFHQLMDESRDDFNRKCAELQEIANHARTQYDVLAKAGQRERADQQRRVKAIRDEIDALKSRQEEKSLHLERLDAVMAQKNREIEIGRENFDKLFEVYESYKKAHDEEVHTLVERGRQGDANLEAALASLKETEDRMKWAIQVKNEVKGAN
ncbi:hypothetical protein F9C07_2199468 [Aspergillus flavus]|uniref:SWI5-dependent HO expression protein 3 n=5 Tax=Aspergillus subgen. Circumdati TaxID=2720871 RepID=A0A7U2QYK4_ASPFN|nr:hypothetical protein BDV35DRAFT_394579 [Aspergillus flavus]KAF7628052.1 hypothetical protein AFLA_003417 [Aspergillus flavus NRRL3357]OOO13125.1 hypothetical protein OAory_01008740 [Aspergillus oryzae]KAJ1713691.1 hypothetical protein NYO67_4135 [Aspergillus flavus]QMW38343.1 hypothetical protein G4B11_001579 [Aspergillus flavus]